MDLLKKIVTELREKIMKLKKFVAIKKYDEKKFHCRKCDEKFNSMKTLKNHIREFHPQKIKCKECNEVFDLKCKLETHMKEKHKLPSYKCDKCDKEFILEC